MGNDISHLDVFVDDLLKEVKPFPKLNIGNRQGATDYIDFIKLDEVTSPIMWGKDKFNRYFIVLKLFIDNKIILQTFFQRYSDNIVSWRACGHATKLLFDSTTKIHEENFKLLISLIKGNNCIIQECNDPSDAIYIGNKVSVLDSKITNAISIIERNWQFCRYDPTFKMCEKVQSKNLENIINSK
jgi:hypothetical protein